MKRIYVVYILFLVAFAGLVVSTVWLLTAHHPVGALYAGLAALGVAVTMIWHINRDFQLFRRMLLSIGDDDFATLGFPQKKFSHPFTAELNRAFQHYKAREKENQTVRLSYEMLLDKTDTAFVIANPDTSVDWMNQAALFSVGHLARLNQLDALCPGFSHTLFQGKIGETFVVSFNRNDMQYDMAVSTNRLNEKWIITLQNIRSLLEANELIAWQRLISVLTHEIMNSLTPIISLSETLIERVSDPDCVRALDTIRRRSSGLQQFVENYRKITRVPLPVKASFPLGDLLDDVRRCFPDGTLALPDDTASMRLMADRAQLEQVLINLVKNALEADAPVPVTVEAAVHPFTNNIILTVRDKGRGIAPDVLDKIFIPFFSTKPSGSGIGLSLCKQIISLHGGTLTATSEEGQGAAFRISLP